MLPTRDTSDLKTHTNKMKEWKKIYHANANKKKTEVAILISDKIDFKSKTVTRDKEGNYVIIKGPIQQEDITPVNIYAPDIGAPKYTKQILTDAKGDIDSNMLLVQDLNNPLISMDRSSKQRSEERRVGNECRSRWSP